MLTTADYWKTAYVGVTPRRFSPGPNGPRPALELPASTNASAARWTLTTFHSREARTAATSYRGVNRPAHEPAYDELATVRRNDPVHRAHGDARDLARIIPSDTAFFLPSSTTPNPPGQ
jgi:hypothetical protein